MKTANKVEDLKAMQAWPLEMKVRVSMARIIEWGMRSGNAPIVSFSGGKDSTVLLDLVRRVYPDTEAAFVDTGLELPEVRKFALGVSNVTRIKPEMTFRQVLDEHGWCFPSKNVAEAVYYARKGSHWALSAFKGLNNDGTPSPYRASVFGRWAFLVGSPFKISAKCCAVMKERPLDRYAKERGGIAAYIGTMASESRRRQASWMKTGCNSYGGPRPASKPLSFWTEQDVLRYLKETGIPYASVYGDIVGDGKGVLRTTGESRTGCVFCPVGCHLDKENKFQRLKLTHPKLHSYVMDKLGLRELLEYVGAEYE